MHQAMKPRTSLQVIREESTHHHSHQVVMMICAKLSARIIELGNKSHRSDVRHNTARSNQERSLRINPVTILGD